MKLPWRAFGLVLLAAASAGATDVHAVLETPRQRIQTADYRATGRMVRIDGNGARTSYAVTIKAHWFPNVLRVFLDVAPAASTEKRTHILFEMRPEGPNSIRIAQARDKVLATLPFNKWADGPAGSAFSYEDFLESQFFWPVQAVEGPVKYGARDCNLLKSTPGPTDKSHYAHVRTWLDATIGFPVYVEKTLRTSNTIKEFTYFGLRKDGGVWSANQIEAKTHGQPGSTLLVIEHGSPKANLTAADFSLEQLTQF